MRNLPGCNNMVESVKPSGEWRHRPSFAAAVLLLWREQIAKGDATCAIAPAVDLVLRDPALTMEAVTFAVQRVRRKSVDSEMRAVLTTKAKTCGGYHSAIVEDLIEYGMSLLDMRLGQRVLGDYVPSDLRHYGEINVEGGKTSILRGRFVIKVADACDKPTVTIRNQLTLEALEAIRASVIDKSPNKQEAIRALTLP